MNTTKQQQQNNSKIIRRRRSECSSLWKKSSSNSCSEDEIMIEYPSGPIHIVSSWNPINRSDKPPYSYATIIGHAILTSKDRKLTLNDIYCWITENYPFYSNETQGWQNSIRHNLSLHKAFVKIDRDSTTTTTTTITQSPPRKGCFWTIRSGKEKLFIDNLQKPINSVRKQHSLSQLSAAAVAAARRQQQQQRRSSSLLVSENSHHNHNHHQQQRLLNNTFRTTHTVPESEPIVVTSSSSSSDHLNKSPISYSNTSSPTSSTYNYQQQLLLLPENSSNSATYHVYNPDENNQELFNSNCSVTYSSTSSSYLTDHIPLPSLSPCDAYSTTTSSSFPANEFYPIATRSQDYTHSSRPPYLLYKGFNTSYSTPYPTSNTNMDWITAHGQESSFKHDNNLLYTSSPPYYYLQRSTTTVNNTADFSSFLHR